MTRWKVVFTECSKKRAKCSFQMYLLSSSKVFGPKAKTIATRCPTRSASTVFPWNTTRQTEAAFLCTLFSVVDLRRVRCVRPTPQLKHPEQLENICPPSLDALRRQLRSTPESQQRRTRHRLCSSCVRHKEPKLCRQFPQRSGNTVRKLIPKLRGPCRRQVVLKARTNRLLWVNARHDYSEAPGMFFFFLVLRRYPPFCSSDFCKKSWCIELKIRST